MPFTASLHPKPFRIYGFINQARLTILIDSGNTHNFIQPKVTKFLNLLTQDTSPLRVMVGNGSVLDCPTTTPQIQHHTFTVIVHVLPISEADVVLGIEWLKQLGIVTIYYTSFIMRFTHLG